MNNLLGSYIDKKRDKKLRVDHDSFCSLDTITDDQARAQNVSEARNFINRKIHGPKGIVHRLQ